MSREAWRQQLLVRALWRDDDAVQAWLRPPARAGVEQALGAYRGNAAAAAVRTLAASHPTLAALVGDESFAALARHHWQAEPPQRGDLGLWGEGLADFVAGRASLADEPYLPDCARLDWAVHRATRAADAAPQPASLQRLADDDPARLRLQLAPGAALVASAFPIASVWHAHHRDAGFAGVRAAFAAGRGETAFVWRDAAHAVQVAAVSVLDAPFLEALRAGHTLADALDRAGDGFAFDAWLARALSDGWLLAVLPHEPEIR